jgi:hypothetical protein
MASEDLMPTDAEPTGLTLAQQSLLRCDDCYEKRPLAWWGRHIRICDSCRTARDDQGIKPHD